MLTFLCFSSSILSFSLAIPFFKRLKLPRCLVSFHTNTINPSFNYLLPFHGYFIVSTKPFSYHFLGQRFPSQTLLLLLLPLPLLKLHFLGYSVSKIPGSKKGLSLVLASDNLRKYIHKGFTMLKQSASRNQRYKGFKVKHVLQICALLALCIWLLNHVRNTYDKKGTGIFGQVTSEHGAIKLGRKDLDPQVQGSSTETNDSAEVEAEEEVEEISKPEESEDDGRGGGDDEIDGRDGEKVEEEETEEVEDLIDEEDRDKDNQIEDLSLLEDQTIHEGEENSQDSKEEHDASSAIVQNNLDTEVAALSTNAMD